MSTEKTTNINTLRRETTFQFLFHLELPINDQHREELIEKTQHELSRYWDEFKVGLTQKLDIESEKKIQLTIKSLLEHHHIVIEKIEQYSQNWKLERISRVNFTILTLAIHELTYIPQTPYKVVINEAVELSKKYGDKDSKDFINALLDKYYRNEVA